MLERRNISAREDMGHDQPGFTIIELLIATVVFSVILLVMAGAIIQIGRLYIKGTTNAKTQEAVRTVVNDISQSLQYGSSGVELRPLAPNPGDTMALCIGTRQYNYVFGQQRSGSAHAVVARTMPAGCQGAAIQDLSSSSVEGTELLGDGMRVSNIDVKETVGGSGVFNVKVRVVYGDIDLLCSINFSCSDTGNIGDDELWLARDLRCKNIRSGTQFCSAAELSTTVERRLAIP